MKVLFIWHPHLMREWFFNLLNAYFEAIGKNKLEYYRHGIPLIQKSLVYTSESRLWSLDIEACFLEFDKRIYIYRDPIDYLLLRYNWGVPEINHDFFRDFIINHLPSYINNIKAHAKIAHLMIRLEDVFKESYFKRMLEIIFEEEVHECFHDIFATFPLDPEVPKDSLSYLNFRLIQKICNERGFMID